MRLLLMLAALLVSTTSRAGETDQFLTENIALEDAADAFNDFLDREIRTFVSRANRRTRPLEDSVALTRALYLHLFQGLHASRVRHWLKNDVAVDRFPDNDLSDLAYQRMSIFRKPVFPFILPMAQTIRVGDIYLGIDKIGHMFGFGRRYFQIYHRHRNSGVDHDAAVEKVVAWGIKHEAGLVGKLVDGIFSHADMEANYQGFRLALALSEGDHPYLYRDGSKWHFRGGLDIRDYINPDFDESYNLNHYSSWRRRAVAPILAEEYGDFYDTRNIRRRFSRYRARSTPSRSKNLIDAHFSASGSDLQRSARTEKTHHDET